MKPTILLGVDELTLVLSIDKSTLDNISEWQPTAESIITEFTQLSNLETIFGTRKPLESTCPQGYSIGYQYGNNPFYFAVAYHPLYLQMGVVVKFSGYSWATYCSKQKTNIKEFLESIQSPSYNLRLSRVDFTADYKDWDISVNDIYKNLMQNKLELRDYKDRKNHSIISAVETNGTANTFYIGSRKTGTRSFCRIYDKREEQIKTKGFRLQEALDTKSWVRIEVVFKGKYAHQLTELILHTAEDKLPNLIADKISEKYRFYDLENDCYTTYTTALSEISAGDFQRLRIDSPRNNDLVQSISHLVNGSGLFPTLYKCDVIWGAETSMNLLQELHNYYTNNYTPNDDTLVWLSKHKDTSKNLSINEILKTVQSLQF